MVTLIYPFGLNWFYAHLAHELTRGLRRQGHTARAIAAHELAQIDLASAETALIISPAECAASLPLGSGPTFARRLRSFSRRVLVNYDSIHTVWFARHLELDPGLFTDLFDIGAAPQAEGTHAGLPYHWIPEAQWLFAEDDSVWTPARPLPWAVIGHADASRAALVSALVRLGRPGGFVYLPPLRPYGAGSGLDATGMRAVLSQCDLYIWNSYHRYPYHEGIRALQAIGAGAVPAKIDPIHAERFAEIPWVYPSLRVMFEALERTGLDGLHRQARAFIERNPAIDQSIASALGLIGMESRTSEKEELDACHFGEGSGLGEQGRKPKPDNAPLPVGSPNAAAAGALE